MWLRHAGMLVALPTWAVPDGLVSVVIQPKDTRWLAKVCPTYAASHCFLNLSWKSFEALDRVIFLTPTPLPPLPKSDLRTIFGYRVWNTRSQNPLLIPYPFSIPRGLWWYR